MTSSSPQKSERKKPKWSSKTLYNRRRNAILKKSTSRIVVKPCRMRNFTRQQTIKLLKATGDEKNKDIYTQDFGKVTRCGAKATLLLAHILEKHIGNTMTKLKNNAEHAGRKTVKVRDLKLL